MAFISELDLDMVLTYHTVCAKKKVSLPFASKVTAQTDTQKYRNTRVVIRIIKKMIMIINIYMHIYISVK